MMTTEQAGYEEYKRTVERLVKLGDFLGSTLTITTVEIPGGTYKVTFEKEAQK